MSRLEVWGMGSNQARPLHLRRTSRSLASSYVYTRGCMLLLYINGIDGGEVEKTERNEKGVGALHHCICEGGRSHPNRQSMVVT
jgi:hypothetical protein